ncbi:hypothetical protein PsYK624_041050 [Phanerochaete sordida]|uniref:Uncharacterized protein n=1 Tax=Phanerochaete sordida TaxID=48140 RepID=A0A9P3G4M6_9APHY|nr:hypothetical protein PsYK624_041050 [Phanerochaete sordida]
MTIHPGPCDVYWAIADGSTLVSLVQTRRSQPRHTYFECFAASLTALFGQRRCCVRSRYEDKATYHAVG